MATYRPCGTRNFTYKQDMAIFRTPFHLGALIAGLILLFLSPYYLSGVLVNLINNIGITIVAVMGLNILTGFCNSVPTIPFPRGTLKKIKIISLTHLL